MTFTYFGEKWDAPNWDDGIAIQVPVGRMCLLCEEPIDEGDSGVMSGHLRLAKPGETPTGFMANGDPYVSSAEPNHLECLLRSIFGSAAHLEGRCWEAGHDEDGVSRREDARAVMRWLRENKHRPVPVTPCRLRPPTPGTTAP